MTMQHWDKNINSIEHHVAMNVNGLCASVLNLMIDMGKPTSAPYVIRDRIAIEDAYVQLGRLLAKIPVTHKEAAE